MRKIRIYDIKYCIDDWCRIPENLPKEIYLYEFELKELFFFDEKETLKNNCWWYIYNKTNWHFEDFSYEFV